MKQGTKKKAMKKTATRKKVVTLKTMYGLMDKKDLKNNMDNYTELLCVKEHQNHSINSFLLHEGNEGMLKNMVIVKMEIIGQPIVKTTREITIKK